VSGGLSTNLLNDVHGRRLYRTRFLNGFWARCLGKGIHRKSFWKNVTRMSTKIQYVSAPAGSGKTFQVGKMAVTLVASENRKIIKSQPTKKLIIQTANDIRKINPAVSVNTIYSHGDGAPVTPRIERHMANADPSKGQILLVTHEALKRLPNAHRVHWDLFVDEIPAVFECIPLKMVKTHQLLTDHLVLEDIAAGISKVKIASQNTANITALKSNESEDQLLGYFGEIANASVGRKPHSDGGNRSL
jgi:reverse gyrase